MSSDRQVAIDARGLHKIYPIYKRPIDRLRQILWSHGAKRHQDFVAVHAVDLTVYRGETVGIVGRNGSGKSTLLKMISGTLEPSGGTLVVDGHVAPILALGIGFDPEFTGRENVLMNGAILGLSDRQLDERLGSIISFADIGEFFDRPVKTYSSGMYSRLAFSVAINADPDVLVIDEVLAVGDEAFTRKCFARIEELKKTGSTVLFVSHAPNLVIELCDRALLMEAGERLLTADPKTVIAQYHKLLYTQKDKFAAVRDQIRQLDRSADSVTEAPAPSATEPENVSLLDLRPRALGRLDESLRPETTVEYERRGAVIENPRILASDGTCVNVLRAGHSYRYAYEVTFQEPAFAVRFGMLIKLTTGFELGGQASHPNGEGLDFVAAGSRARVCFLFQALMLPGVYFLNAGVVAIREGEETYLHRILDAVMFRVENDAPGTATGHVDLGNSMQPSIEIEPIAGHSEPRTAASNDVL